MPRCKSLREHTVGSVSRRAPTTTPCESMLHLTECDAKDAKNAQKVDAQLTRKSVRVDARLTHLERHPLKTPIFAPCRRLDHCPRTCIPMIPSLACVHTTQNLQCSHTRSPRAHRVHPYPRRKRHTPRETAKSTPLERRHNDRVCAPRARIHCTPPTCSVQLTSLSNMPNHHRLVEQPCLSP